MTITLTYIIFQVFTTNIFSQINAKPPPVKKIIEKTRKLKLDEQHCLDQQRRLKELQRPTGVEDIDKDDEKNPFLLSCYVLEIYKYLNALEVKLIPVV